MKVLMLSRYGQLGASSRVRLFQYASSLEARGLEIQQGAFFDDDYLVRLYAGERTAVATLRAIYGRLRQLRQAQKVDVVWVEKEVLPWMPWPIERAFLTHRIPIVSDFDDAVFHNYDLHRSPIVRRLLSRKIDRLMAASVMVIAGNEYLAERARASGARRVEVVPTVVDINAYSIRPISSRTSPLHIGWIGTPSTWSAYMAPMMPLLVEVAGAGSARIVAVGAGKVADPNPLLDNLAWAEETEVAQIQEMDIGIMPLTDTPWARGKCGYKLIQYMACGLPVVASPVGVNAEIVEHGVNGFLASTDAEWRSALETLLANPDLRHRMGSAGRQKIEKEYSLHVYGPRVAEMLAAAARMRRPCSI